jgi:hypothetical protein
MKVPSQNITPVINDYGTDDLGVRRSYVLLGDEQIEVESEGTQGRLTLRRLGSHRGTDLSARLVAITAPVHAERERIATAILARRGVGVAA